MAAVIEIDDLPPTDRVDFLRQHMLASRVPLMLEPRPDETVRVRANWTEIGPAALLSTDASGGAVHRTDRLVRDDSEPAVVFSLLEMGTSTLTQHGRVARQRAGTLVLYESTAPFVATFERITLRHSVIVPRSAVGLSSVSLRDLMAREIPFEHPVGGLVATYLARLSRSVPRMTAEQRELSGAGTLALLRELVGGLANEPRGSTRHAALPELIIEYLERNFARHDLSAAEVAARCGISERQLYAVLASRGLRMRRWLRERRLHEGAHLLRSVPPTTTISEIAHRSGFVDHAHFSKAFLARYAVTPTEWRRGLAADDDRLPADGTRSPLELA